MIEANAVGMIPAEVMMSMPPQAAMFMGVVPKARVTARRLSPLSTPRFLPHDTEVCTQ